MDFHGMFSFLFVAIFLIDFMEQDAGRLVSRRVVFEYTGPDLPIAK